MAASAGTQSTGGGSYFGGSTAAQGPLWAEPRSTGKTGFLGLIDPWLQMWKHYADPKGRATRKEFWTIWLINFIIQLILSFTLVGSTIYGWVILVPMFCLFLRRCHDFGSDGKMFSLLYIGFYPAASILTMIGSLQFIGWYLGFGFDLEAIGYAIIYGRFPIAPFVLMLIGSLLGIGYIVVLLIVGLKASQPADNEYGPYEYGQVR